MGRFELIHGQNHLTISDFFHSAADAASGNPYNTTFRIHVVSGEFSGAGECECDMAEFKKFVEGMELLYGFGRSEAALLDIGYGTTVLFQMDKVGHVEISGEIFGNAMCQSLRFGFEADQTSLQPFIKSMKTCVEM
jgi:hypothetical protein